MAKQNKQEESKELKSILAKLKKSYDEESKVDLDSVQSDSENEEDKELNDILEKLFSSTQVAESESADTVTEQQFEMIEEDAEIISEDKISEDKEMDCSKDEALDEEPVSSTDTYEEVIEAVDLSDTEGSKENEAKELLASLFEENPEQQVEDVLQAMFPATSTPEIVEDINYLKAEENIDLNVDNEIIEETIEEKVEETIEETVEETIEEKVEETIEETVEETIEEKVEETIEETVEETIEEAVEEEFAVEDEEYDTSLLQDDIQGKIISVEQYIDDPLQERLPAFDVLEGAFEDNSQKMNDTADFSEAKEHKLSSSLDNSDISLLLKFGYDNEVKSKIGEDEAHKAILEADKEFVPEPHKIVYGFCDKEFSDKSQVRKIKTKYKSEKMGLIFNLIAISLISALILALDLFFEFFSDRSSYLLVLSFELVLVAVIALILRKRIISGFLGVLRFEGNIYSVLLFLLFSYALYDVVTAILYLVNINSINISDLMLFGFSIALYSILIVISDLTNCLREANTFAIVSASQGIYTAEENKETQNGIMTGPRLNYAIKGEKSYFVHKTSMISGYFKKMSESVNASINLIYIYGIVPIASLVMGCAIAIFSESIMRGVTSMMMTSLMCIPLFYVCIPTLTEYVVSINLKKKKTAFIGTAPIAEYAKSDFVYFSDVDAIDIISCTEIHPTKSENSKKFLSLAHSVFASLGGPLGNATVQYSDLDNTEDEKENDIVINSISDNGIDIYFNSSMNILIGDRQYMQAHNIKVKTDPNLATATKGYDRAVIYMSFDGVPKLGFIITSRIKPTFADMVSKFDLGGIKVIVKSYEPQINDLYFEQNKPERMPSVGVYKSGEYQSMRVSSICNGIVASELDSLSVADLIFVGKKVAERRKQNQRILFVLVLAGFFVSALLGALLSITDAIFILSGLKTHITLLFNLLTVLALIPGVVSLLKLKKQI